MVGVIPDLIREPPHCHSGPDPESHSATRDPESEFRMTMVGVIPDLIRELTHCHSGLDPESLLMRP